MCIRDIYYYETGSVQGGKGLVEVDGSYYYVLPSGKVAVDSDRAVPDGLLPAGTYRFGADGKLAQGATDVDGTLYYYERGLLQKGKYIVRSGDDYYFVLPSGKVAVNSDRAVPDGLLPAGTYRFGADGKLINPPVAA